MSKIGAFYNITISRPRADTLAKLPKSPPAFLPRLQTQLQHFSSSLRMMSMWSILILQSTFYRQSGSHAFVYSTERKKTCHVKESPDCRYNMHLLWLKPLRNIAPSTLSYLPKVVLSSTHQAGPHLIKGCQQEKTECVSTPVCDTFNSYIICYSLHFMHCAHPQSTQSISHKGRCLQRLYLSKSISYSH